MYQDTLKRIYNADKIIYGLEERLRQWKHARAEYYRELRQVCPHPAIITETDPATGKREQICEICKGVVR